ncbi:MAG: aspartyl protease family protein, partial [Dyella sp.]
LAAPLWAGECQLTDFGTLPVEMVGDKATTVVKINGQSARLVIDTGAFYNIMSAASAASFGLDTKAMPFGFRIGGVGGTTDTRQARVKEFGILDSTLKNIDFLVGGTDVGNGLIGANLLDLVDLEIDLAHGKVTLFKSQHCEKASLAYWTKDGAYNVVDTEPSLRDSDRRTFVNVMVNGKKLHALLDTGAAATVLSRIAAERAGIDVNGPNVKRGPRNFFGIGRKLVNSWTVPVDSFSVGTETIQHSQMQVLDGTLGEDVDMLLGVDFILAHHMFIANSSKKIYFTYNGGRLFTYAAASNDSGPAPAGSAASADPTAPKTANDYLLSGRAHLARGELSEAIGDLDEAIRLAPDQAAYYRARANAHLASKQPQAALTDLDTSLSLDPKDLDALLLRAALRVARDRPGAVSDVAAASTLPANAAQSRELASLYIELGQPAAALPLLDAWISQHGDGDAMLGEVLNQRCWARTLSNQSLDDALKDCRRAIKRSGDNPAYLNSLGLVQLRLGHYAESIQAYQQVLAKNPHAAWARYGLGLAEIRSGQSDAGNADLTSARALDSHVEARFRQYGLVTAP